MEQIKELTNATWCARNRLLFPPKRKSNTRIANLQNTLNVRNIDSMWIVFSTCCTEIYAVFQYCLWKIHPKNDTLHAQCCTSRLSKLSQVTSVFQRCLLLDQFLFDTFLLKWKEKNREALCWMENKMQAADPLPTTLTTTAVPTLLRKVLNSGLDLQVFLWSFFLLREGAMKHHSFCFRIISGTEIRGIISILIT